MQLNEFKTIRLNPIGKEKVDQIHQEFHDLLCELEKLCYRNEDFIACKQNLKAASFFAVRAMCAKPDNQEIK